MFWIIVFIISFLILFWSGSKVVTGLMKMAKYLGWREFVVAFFVMAFAGTLPNLFIGINSALNGIPELSFGEIVGGNVVDMTLAVGLALLFGGRALPVKSKMVQTSTIFTAVAAVLPLVLILDGSLDRLDGVILLFFFFLYIFWIFSKGERFKKIYRAGEEKRKISIWDYLKEDKEPRTIRQFKAFFKNLRSTTIALILLVLSSWGVVQSIQVFSDTMSVSLPIIGILLVGLGNALPETYFAILSARRGRTWLILGDLMGSVIVCATFVLGIVVLISPIKNIDFSPFAIARIFLVISAVYFLIAVRTDQKITKKEGIFLILIYFAFLAAEIFFH